MTSRVTTRQRPQLKESFLFVEEGVGPPILLLHGLFGTLSNWEHTQRRFSQHYRVLNLQFPLYNQQFHTVDTLTDYVEGFVSEQRIPELAIFGNSLGGHVALNYALREPGRVRCMVLAGSGGLFERGFDRNIMIHPDREYLRKKISEVFYDPSFATEEQIQEVESVISTTRRKLSLVKIARSARTNNMRDQLPNIRCPVCLVWGREDKITPVAVAQTFKEKLADARLVYIEKCGHAPIIERPEEFNRHAAEFLQGLPY